MCTVLLRDRETALYERMIAERGLANRVILAEVSTRREVEDAFNATDVVLFLMQRKVTKDVPNSIIDGFVLGKPVLMTSVVDLAEVVRARGLGWVVEPGDAIDVRTIAATYDASCQNAAAYAEGMTPGRYVETVTAGYRA